MSQNFAAQTGVNAAGGVGFNQFGPLGNLLVNDGARNTALNQTTQAVIKAGAGRFFGIIVNAPGSTSGAWTLNDSATTGAVAAANLIAQTAYNATANLEGAVLMAAPGGVPFTNGLVLNVPGGGSPICTVLYS